jgi:hypothetical protein
MNRATRYRTEITGLGAVTTSTLVPRIASARVVSSRSVIRLKIRIFDMVEISLP